MKYGRFIEHRGGGGFIQLYYKDIIFETRGESKEKNVDERG